ncbi:glycosyltransferase [Candidatus Pelagibacter sp.]|nr:glycosyltransferase [Candidatus Pelagibacter sp.]
MKICINFESSPREGGAFHVNINLLKIFNEYNNNEFDFTYIASSKKIKDILESYGCKTVFLKKNIFFRIHQFLFKFIFFKYLFKKLNIKNAYEKFVIKNKFELSLFNSPSEISLLASNLPFIIFLFEFQHRTDNYLPEYVGSHDFNLRELIIENATKRAFKILVATNKDKDMVKKLYNGIDKNIVIQPYVPFLPDIYENNKEKVNYKLVFNDLKITNTKFLFYPAQFWPHKNHKYIIDAVDYAVNTAHENLHVVFSGYDKGNLKYINSQIKLKKLENNVQIFDYLSNDQIISLYLNSSALVMPTFVGHSTLPLYEAFYFKLPVFFSKDLLDEKLKDLIYEIDLFDVQDLLHKYKLLENEKMNKEIKVSSALKFYNNNCSRKQLFINFKNIFKEYRYLKARWS